MVLLNNVACHLNEVLRLTFCYVRLMVMELARK